MTFPFFNIFNIDNKTKVLEIALAGYEPEEINVSASAKKLVISAEKKREFHENEKTRSYSARGITYKSFIREFKLINTKVKDISYKNGLLTITFVTEIPESDQLKVLEIKTA